MQQKYDQYDSDESSGSNSDGDEDYDDIDMRFSPYTTIQGVISHIFGTEYEGSQSFGFGFEDTRLEDGAVYADQDKRSIKTFSWKDVTGLSVSETLERGDEPSLDDLPEVEAKTYGSTDKTYELVGARLPEVTAPDGDVVVETQSKVRDVEFGEDGLEGFGEWEDLDGELVSLPPTNTWYSGHDDYGPSMASMRIWETVSKFGEDSIVDEDDIGNWLPDTSNSNVLRDDLEDRQVRFFLVSRESENGYTYHVPVFEDLATDARISPNNRGDSDDMEEAKQADADERSYPEPVADFISSGSNLNLNEERAEGLLDELLSDEDNSLTEGMLEDAGGRDDIIAEVL